MCINLHFSHLIIYYILSSRSINNIKNVHFYNCIIFYGIFDPLLYINIALDVFFLIFLSVFGWIMITYYHLTVLDTLELLECFVKSLHYPFILLVRYTLSIFMKSWFAYQNNWSIKPSLMQFKQVKHVLLEILILNVFAVCARTTQIYFTWTIMPRKILLHCKTVTIRYLKT